MTKRSFSHLLLYTTLATLPLFGTTAIGNTLSASSAVITAPTGTLTSTSTAVATPPASIIPSNVVTKLTLAQALKVALENNLDLKLLAEDLKFRELDQDKAAYYSDLQRDANRQVINGWEALNLQKAEFERVKDFLPPDIRAAKQAELDAATAQLEAASQYKTDTLEEAQVASLIQEKARVGFVVTKAALDLAAKKITLLTQKSYYDVLKAQRLVTLKKSALQRAESQLKLARAGYQEGMRAKDDYLLAQCQVDLMQADLAKANSTLANSETEFIKVLNLPGQTKLELLDDFTTTPLPIDLTANVKQGLSKRVEIIKATRELEVAKINLELAIRYSSATTFAGREAQLTVQKAELELAKQTAACEADIRQAASSLSATQAMLKSIQKSTPQATESLAIATLRYREGYGLPNSTLKALHAEDAAGTILEVIAAQEKLAEIEEKVTEIIYSHNLARTNYLISIGEEVAQ